MTFCIGEKICMKKSIRTDLAREAVQLYGEMEGVEQVTQEKDGVTCSSVRVLTETAAKRLNKRIGLYVTVEPAMDGRDHTSAVINAIQETLGDMLPRACRHVLVLGLGNRMITPDALGPRTAEHVFVTRHIATHVPELALPGMRLVSAITPGVLGVTGLETVEVIRGVAHAVRPDALLCIDALAAEEAQHIGRTVQLNDNGLLPGAGVGNRQRELHEGALGLPVLAIGVPTVVSASAIARETARRMALDSGDAAHADAFAALGGQIAEKCMAGMVVTPKDIDKLICDASRRVAEGVNRALHGGQYEELQALLQH